MRIWIRTIFLCMLVAPALAAPPRVFLLDGDRLEHSRQRLQQGDAVLKLALEKLKHDADKAMSLGPFSVVDKEIAPPSGDKHDYMSRAPYYWPNPDTPDHLPYIRKDGEVNPEYHKIPDVTSLKTMSQTVQLLALAYYFTGERRYADRATLLLRTWFLDPKTRMNPNLQFAQAIPGVNTGRGIGIIETLHFTDVIDALGLLAGSSTWTGADDRAIRDWFSQYLTWLRESPNGRDESRWANNHGTMYDVQASTYALILGNDDIAKQILSTVPERRYKVQIEADGRQPLELERTKAWSYSIMNIRGHMQLATLARHVDVDLWNAQTSDGRGMRKALDFLIPFAIEEKPWPYQQINGFRPQGAQTLIRVAAEVYRDDKYRQLVAKVPPLEPSDLDQLVGTQLVPNAQDQR